MEGKRKDISQEIFKFIKDYFEKNHIPPSVREIALRFGFSSTSTVAYYLQKLEKQGFIKRSSKKARNIFIPDLPAKRLPVLGVIRAGMPTYAEENIEGYLDLESHLLKKGDFLLRVKGDSMVNAGIFDGDLVLVKKSPVVQPGEIGVFLVDGESTVKEFQVIDGKPALVPKNKNYSIIFPAEIYVIGKVTAVIRDLAD